MNVRLAERVDALDPGLFDQVESQTTEGDRRALLALHAAATNTLGRFTYLEIGSYLGGSLQVVIRDPRCEAIISIDPRPPLPPDKRGGSWTYAGNSTAEMLSNLRAVPGAELDKLTTLEASTEDLTRADIPRRPDYCFVDGEHTDEAVLRDGLFCAEALGGAGVVAFHDHAVIRPGIRAFLKRVWGDIAYVAALSFPPRGADGSGVLAVELGGRSLLTSEPVRREIGSAWHERTWDLTSRAGSPLPFLGALLLMPSLDRAIAAVRRLADLRTTRGS